MANNNKDETANLQAATTQKWGEIGTSGIEAFAGFIKMAYHADLRYPECIPLFNRIYRSDPEVAMARVVQSSFGSRLSPTFDIDPIVENPTDDDKRAVDFANEVLDDIEDGIGKWMTNALTRGPFYGWGWWEAVPGLRQEGWRPPGRDPWRSSYNDNLIGYRRLGFRHYESFYDWNLDEKTGRVLGLNQYDYPNEMVMIPIDRSLHIVFGDTDSPEGLPIMEALWRLERIKFKYEMIMGIGFEHSAGHVQILTEEKLGETVPAAIKAMARSLLTAQEGNFATWPKGVKGEVVDVPFQSGGSLLDVIRYYGILKMSLIFMQWAAMGTLSAYGSYSSMKDANVFYLGVFNSIAEAFIKQADDQIGRRLFEFPVNAAAFPNMTRRPRLTVNRVHKLVDLNELAAFIKAYNEIAPLGEDDLIEIRRKSETLPEALPEFAAVEQKPAKDQNKQGDQTSKTADGSMTDQGTPTPPDKTASDQTPGDLEMVNFAMHDGIMVAFSVPPEIASSLVLKDVDGALPIEELHLTLTYLGTMREQQASKRALLAAVQSFASRMKPVRGRINGYGKFTETHMTGKNAIWASYDSPDLPAFREQLVNLLDRIGFKTANDHGFTPHITLAYSTEDISIDNIQGVIDLDFKYIAVAWGDEHHHFMLLGDEGEENAGVGELVFRPFVVPDGELPTDVIHEADDPTDGIDSALNKFRKWAEKNDPVMVEWLDAEIRDDRNAEQS